MHTATVDTTTPLTGAVQVLLKKGSLVRGCGRVALKVLAGRLWLTRSGEPEDVFISAGERIELALGGKALIEADFDTVVELASVRATGHDHEEPRLTITPNCWIAA